MGSRAAKKSEMVVLCGGCVSKRPGLSRIGTAAELETVVIEGSCHDCGRDVGLYKGPTRSFPKEMVDTWAPQPQLVEQRGSCGARCENRPHIHFDPKPKALLVYADGTVESHDDIDLGALRVVGPDRRTGGVRTFERVLALNDLGGFPVYVEQPQSGEAAKKGIKAMRARRSDPDKPTG